MLMAVIRATLHFNPRSNEGTVFSPNPASTRSLFAISRESVESQRRFYIEGSLRGHSFLIFVELYVCLSRFFGGGCEA